MFCIRCFNEDFEHVENVIHAEHRFGNKHKSPDELPGPGLRCKRCNLQLINHGTHLEATTEPDFLPAA